ncbi:MAG: hypothetical protein ABJE47_23310 [bacterium]
MVVVTEGPNTDLVFFDDLPFRTEFAVEYNANAMRDSSVFQHMQPATRTGTTCSKADVTGFISLVKAHEGFSITDHNSHSDVYKRSFEDSTRVPIERFVQRSTGANVDAIQDAARAWAGAESHRITGGTYPFQAPCVFNYNPAQIYP